MRPGFGTTPLRFEPVQQTTKFNLVPNVHVHAICMFWIQQQLNHAGGCALKHSLVAELVVAGRLTVQCEPGGAGPHSLVAEPVHVELRRPDGLGRRDRLQPDPERLPLRLPLLLWWHLHIGNTWPGLAR